NSFGYSKFTNLLTRIRLEENQYKEKEPNSLFNDCLILFIYSLSTGFDKEPQNKTHINI
ncbi:transposase, partial [Lactobacillus helveticus MTCC 5463]